MTTPDWERAQQYILQRLQLELPEGLGYHGVHHTRDDVLPAAERLARLAGLDDEAWLLLRTAALYHDVGYIEQYFRNEPIAVRLAEETLPDFAYSPAQIEAIVDIIMATRMPQAPRTYLAELLCDADLDSLGREDYWATSVALREELRLHGMEIPMLQWLNRQHQFLSTHTYFTKVARDLRNAGKRENIAMLERRLADATAEL